jgi:hypothetical protein
VQREPGVRQRECWFRVQAFDELDGVLLAGNDAALQSARIGLEPIQ